MKKYTIYIGILVVGLLLGWLLFGGSSNNDEEHNHNAVTETNQIWTCSMHPQIMQPEPGDCPICAMDLIPAESGAEGLLADQFKLTENAMALANIQTSIVGNSMVDENAIKLSGKIVENEEANAVQVSYFSGRIEKLNVSFTGEEVRKGQLLATIYSPELFAAQQELITAASLKESQPALYKAVRNKLKLWKLSESQITQIERSGKVKENFPVYATVSGTVAEKLVEQGDFIKQGQALLKIANLKTVWANFDVFENQLDLFKKGQEVSIITSANPNVVFKAKVDFIDPILDTRTRTVKLRTVLNNKSGVFKPGMFVEGKIAGVKSSKGQVLIIPSTAVLWTGERSIVYVKTNPEEPIFEMREVSLGNSLEDNYEVLEGLNNGDEIVTNGTFTIDAAAQLQGKKSMMNKEGGKVMTGHEGHLGSQSTTSSTSDNMKMEYDTVQKDMVLLLNNYLQLKDALVASDSNNTKQIANDTYISLKSIETLGLGTMEMEHLEIISELLISMAENNSLENQREQFISLSENMINMSASLKKLDIPLFVQHCPMANNDKGANWLSNKREIKNPYYGEAMLTCGSVQRVIHE